ncbi:MAG: tetratricopeptide repeat protein [Planctomycetota bacterium]
MGDVPIRFGALALALVVLGCGDSAPQGTPAAFEQALQRARALQASGAPAPEVLAAFESAQALAPDDCAVNLALSQLYQELKLLEPARACLERAVSARPADHKNLLTLATLEVRGGHHEQAEARLVALQGVAETRAPALHQLVLLREQQGQLGEALALAQQGAQLHPQHAWRFLAFIGRVQLEEGQPAEARASFQRALEGRPDSREALKGLADASRRLGDESTAARCDRALLLFTDLNDNVFMKSDAAVLRRRALLEQLVQEYPEWIGGFRELADLALDGGDQAAACRTIERLLEVHAARVPAPDAAQLRQHYCTQRSSR